MEATCLGGAVVVAATFVIGECNWRGSGVIAQV